MYRILIVDDEPLVREQLLSLLDWPREGFSAEEAFDGEMALDCLKAHPADMILTDIKMPIMDGLELIKRAKAISPDCRFVVLSAYDEFDLVREAFKLGAYDYLLKSDLKKDVVRNMLGELKKDLENSRNRMKRNDNRRNLQQEQLRQLLATGRMTDASPFREEFPFLKKGALIRIALIQILLPDKNSWSPSLQSRVEARIDDLSEPYRGDMALYVKDPLEYVLILSNRIHITDQLPVLLSMMEKSLKDCLEYLEADMVIGISDEGCVAMAHQLLEQAHKACEYRFVDCFGRIFWYASVKKQSSLDDTFLESKASLISDLLSNAKVQDIHMQLNHLCVRKEDISMDDIGKVRELFHRYYVYIYDFSTENKIKETLRPYLERFPDLYSAGSLQDLNQWILEVMEFLNSTKMKLDRTVRETIQYIKKNYNQEITLTSAAEYAGVRPEYLSRVFKNETGITVSKYIEETRIRNAICLMKENKMKIYEISQIVGYNSEHYFSRVFKKMTGMSPKKFLQKQ